MIPISQGCIDTYIEQQKRDKMSYIQRLIARVKEENPTLFLKIIDGAKTFGVQITEDRHKRKITNDDFARTVEMNIILYALSVYHCIDIQMEVDALEEQFNKKGN